MNLCSMKDGKMRVRELVELALLTALTVTGKEVMNVLPNIHPVTLFLLLGVLLYGWRVLWAAVVFSLIEIALYGVSTLSYLYIWPLMVLTALPFRKCESPLFWGAFAGVFGLCFGALCAVPYLFAGGWAAMVSYWVAGIPFDLVHGLSNAVLAFLLLMPLYRICRQFSAAGE